MEYKFIKNLRETEKWRGFYINGSRTAGEEINQYHSLGK